jgi:hypothetical protein
MAGDRKPEQNALVDVPPKPYSRRHRVAVPERVSGRLRAG